MLGLVVGNRNPRQMRDAADSLVINGHRKPQKTAETRGRSSGV
jgi:hypothetical protein